MHSIQNWLGFVPLLAAACVGATADPDEVDVASETQASAVPHAVGGGQYALNDLVVRFAFVATQLPNGNAIGAFHVDTAYDGLTADFSARVTCLSIDEVNRRAWVGGVITKNKSTDPDYAAPLYQPARDIWFRAVDYGPGGSGAPDRSTFVGFEGAAGFPTSVAYCAGRPWPDADARTWPVTSGNIVIRP